MSTLFKNLETKVFEFSPKDYAEAVFDTNVSIPAFQRNYEWGNKKNKITELMDSIYNGYNLGTIIIWVSNEKKYSRKSKNIFKVNTNEKVIEYIIDGQQRTITLITMLTNNNVIDIDLNSLYICFDKPTGKLFFEKTKTKGVLFITFQEFKSEILNTNRGLLDLKQFLRKKPELEKLIIDEDVKIFENELYEKLKKNIITKKLVIGYKLQADTSDLSIAIKQFERINMTGVPLTELDILDSMAYLNNGYDMKKHIKTLKKSGFGAVVSKKNNDEEFSTEIIKIILNSYKLIKNFNTDNTFSLSPKAISKFENNDTKIFEDIFKYLKTCMSELKRLQIVSLKDVPFTPNVVVFIFIKYWLKKSKKIENIPNYSDGDFLYLIMFMTGIQRSYEKSSSHKIIEHIKKIVKQIDSGKNIDILERENYSLTKSDIENTNYMKISSVEKAIFIMWANKLKLIDYLKNEEFRLDGIFKESKNIDHIFSRKLYEKVKKNSVHCISNLTLITKVTNQKKSSDEPSNFFNTIDFTKNYEMYNSHSITKDAYEMLIINDFDNFIKLRTDEIVRTLNNHLESLKNISKQ